MTPCFYFIGNGLGALAVSPIINLTGWLSKPFLHPVQSPLGVFTMSEYFSIYFRVTNPTLNKNIGRFNLPYIWDRLLFNTPGLKIKKACTRCWACSV